MVRAENLAMINQFKTLYSQFYKAGPNKFTHLSLSEFSQTYLGYKGISPNVEAATVTVKPQQLENTNEGGDIRPRIDGQGLSNIMKSVYYGPGSVPPTVFYVNWNGTNATYVTNVKNQGGCGSCWAFAGVAEIESYYLWKHKLYLDLSEQQMVDCLPLLQPSNLGCGGGYLDSVGLYSVRYAVATEQVYSYTATEGTCATAKVNAAQYSINSYVFISDCNTLANTLLNQKPIGICMNIDNKWNSYVSGVIPNCNDTKIGGHCVLLVGAKSDGTTDPLNNYWIVRNSWGTSYGEYGFMRLYKDPADINSGFCGMCTSAIYSQ